MPHTYHGLIVNPDCNEAREAVEGAAADNGGELDHFDCFEQHGKAHAFVKFDTDDEARKKLQPMKQGIESRGVRTYINSVATEFEILVGP